MQLEEAVSKQSSTNGDQQPYLSATVSLHRVKIETNGSAAADKGGGASQQAYAPCKITPPEPGRCFDAFCVVGFDFAIVVGQQPTASRQGPRKTDHQPTHHPRASDFRRSLKFMR